MKILLTNLIYEYLIGFEANRVGISVCKCVFMCVCLCVYVNLKFHNVVTFN